ncbi:solute carrier family 23 member 1-like [Mytilus edulis]|uniref:solute carrier family 23 member 1-like n=1 Tax=Mytilus edulis TaxID=6550 RepID=UPI0039EE24AC
MEGRRTLSGLQYKVEDNPTWITTVFLAFQHYLMLLSSNLATPGLVAITICAQGDVEVASILLGNMLFACGICTVIQFFFGVRLPIVQCPQYAYVVPAIVLTSFDEWKCPDISVASSNTSNVVISNFTLGNFTDINEQPYWQQRLNMITGSLMVASVFEIILGASGILTILLRFIGPLTVAPTIMMMGLGVLQPVYELAGSHWGIAFGTMAMIVMLSECIPKFNVSLPCHINLTAKQEPCTKKQIHKKTEIVAHKMFSVSIVLFNYVGFSSKSKCDAFIDQFDGLISLGILIEGIDCIIAASVGAGFGVTSCSQNIGAISLTKVGSRRVVLVAGILMMIFGCFNKFSTLMVTIPDPIVGASFIVLFGVLAAVGASNLQYVDLNSTRNMVVFGISLFMGFALPIWTQQNEAIFKQGDGNGKQVLLALLGNSMFMACFTALVLDNVIPGTDHERGILSWRELTKEHLDDKENFSLRTYDLPFGMSKIKSWSWARYIPFSPTFKEDKCGPCTKSKGIESIGEEVNIILSDNCGHV